MKDRLQMFTKSEQLLAARLQHAPRDRVAFSWVDAWDTLGRDQLPHLPAHEQIAHAAKRLVAVCALIAELEAENVQDHGR